MRRGVSRGDVEWDCSKGLDGLKYASPARKKDRVPKKKRTKPFVRFRKISEKPETEKPSAKKIK